MKCAAKDNNCRPGAALLVVLFIITAITLISFGFIAKSDMELACAANVPLRMQMDYLAQSGLEHARVLLINPQDTDAAGYWQGGTGLYIVDGDDKYNLIITQSSACTYVINCEAYRQRDGEEKVAVSELNATLRLDPFIAYYQGVKQPIDDDMEINGDVYVNDELENNGVINGDEFTNGTITVAGTLTGSENISASPVAPPSIIPDYSEPYYYKDGGPYTAELLNSSYDASSFPTPGANNSANVYYCGGDLNLSNITAINGTLIVTGDLHLKEGCNITITPFKNMPALIVGKKLHFDNVSQSLHSNGYTQVGHHIDMGNNTGVTLRVDGALYILGDGIKNVLSTVDCVVVNADPVKGSLKIWTDASSSRLWSPAGGGFFKSVSRSTP